MPSRAADAPPTGGQGLVTLRSFRLPGALTKRAIVEARGPGGGAACGHLDQAVSSARVSGPPCWRCALERRGIHCPVVAATRRHQHRLLYRACLLSLAVALVVVSMRWGEEDGAISKPVVSGSPFLSRARSLSSTWQLRQLS